MSRPAVEALDLIEGVMTDWAWRRDLMQVVGGDPNRIADLLSRAEERQLFREG